MKYVVALELGAIPMTSEKTRPCTSSGAATTVSDAQRLSVGIQGDV